MHRLSAKNCNCRPASNAFRYWHCTVNTTKWYSRSEEHTSELQSLMRNSYAAFWLKKKKRLTQKSKKRAKNRITEQPQKQNLDNTSVKTGKASHTTVYGVE